MSILKSQKMSCQKKKENAWKDFVQFLIELLQSLYYVIIKAIKKLTFWTWGIVSWHIFKQKLLADWRITLLYFLFCIFVVNQKILLEYIKAYKASGIKLNVNNDTFKTIRKGPGADE